ncbi:hypothetical protein MKK84_29725 [Methylobacterium sp. E-065]|nr:hypothetical protein [Methylobacterium sp. E-065]
MLVIVSGLLVAVLVRDAPWHERPGAWHLEAGLGRLAGVRAPVFDTLEDATRWVRQHLREDTPHGPSPGKS